MCPFSYTLESTKNHLYYSSYERFGNGYTISLTPDSVAHYFF